MTGNRYLDNPYVDKYLLPGEDRIFAARQHPAVLMPPVMAAVSGLLAASVVSVSYGKANPAKTVVWALFFWLASRLIWRSLSWTNRWMALTSERFLLIEAYFGSRIKSIPLPRFTEMTFTRSATGKLLGFGTFTIEADGKAQIVIDYVPFSEQIQLMLGGRLYAGATDLTSRSDYEEPEYEVDMSDVDVFARSPESWSEKVTREYSDVLRPSNPIPSAPEDSS